MAEPQQPGPKLVMPQKQKPQAPMPQKTAPQDTQNLASSNEVSVPTWNCRLEPKNQITVGQKLNLNCQGFDEIEIDKRYELVNDKGDPYHLNLLKVRKDGPMTKEFIVTPYRVYEGSLILVLKDKESNKKLFQAGINDIKVNSVIENKADAQMAGPVGASWVLFSPLEFSVLILALILSVGYTVFKTYKRQKLKREFKNTMKMVNYEDPFMDLNVDLLAIERNHKMVKNLKPHIENALKKFFYHFFKKPVFFDTPAKMNRELKKLKVPEYEMRAIGVIKNDFEKIQSGVDFDTESKKDFIQSAKQNLNRLKRYQKRGSQ